MSTHTLTPLFHTRAQYDSNTHIDTRTHTHIYACTHDRIEIFPALVDPVSASSNPLHFFGLHGKTCAAVQHYAATSAAAAAAPPPPPPAQSVCSHATPATSCSRAVGTSSVPAPEALQNKDKDKEKPLLIAAVAANGVNGRTAWSKDLRLTAEDVALLAGGHGLGFFCTSAEYDFVLHLVCQLAG
eukprot:1157431-Pelagomonas_calceolata.AAC.2